MTPRIRSTLYFSNHLRNAKELAIVFGTETLIVPKGKQLLFHIDGPVDAKVFVEIHEEQLVIRPDSDVTISVADLEDDELNYRGDQVSGN